MVIPSIGELEGDLPKITTLCLCLMATIDVEANIAVISKLIVRLTKLLVLQKTSEQRFNSYHSMVLLKAT